MANKKQNKNYDWLIIAIFCLVCSIAWIASNTYHRYTKRKKSLIPNELLKPLNPNLNKEIFTQLEKRPYRPASEIEKLLQEGQKDAPSPTETPVEQPTTSPPTATPSP